MKPHILILQAARDVIAAGFWTKGWFARDKDGLMVNDTSKHACSFCALGALSGAAFDLGARGEDREKAIRAFEEACLPGVSTDKNDSAKSNRQVVDLFDRALAAEWEKETA